MNEVTQILRAIDRGDPRATEALLPLVYGELRQLAAAKFANEAPGQTLQATALVHEAFIRLLGTDQEWDSRKHFFSAAAEAMRRILIERARQKKTEKRGGGFKRVDFEADAVISEQKSEELLAVDDALTRLAEIDPIKAELVKLRYFAGLTIPQAAEALQIGVSTAEKYWAYTKCWMKAEISGVQNKNASTPQKLFGNP